MIFIVYVSQIVLLFGTDLMLSTCAMWHRTMQDSNPVEGNCWCLKRGEKWKQLSVLYVDSFLQKKKSGCWK